MPPEAAEALKRAQAAVAGNTSLNIQKDLEKNIEKNIEKKDKL
jgi:hypothetical protein